MCGVIAVMISICNAIFCYFFFCFVFCRELLLLHLFFLAFLWRLLCVLFSSLSRLLFLSFYLITKKKKKKSSFPLLNPTIHTHTEKNT